jgi:hypothetical protein
VLRLLVSLSSHLEELQQDLLANLKLASAVFASFIGAESEILTPSERSMTSLSEPYEGLMKWHKLSEN